MRWWAKWCTLFKKNPYLEEYKGRILGRNPDKSLQSFPPCYSQSPLQLCFEIYSYFFKLTQPLTVSTVQLLYTVKEKGGKPDRTPYPIPNGLRNQYRNLKSECELSRLCPETSTKLYVQEFGFWLKFTQWLLVVRWFLPLVSSEGIVLTFPL
jgi:hypothetical protein